MKKHNYNPGVELLFLLKQQRYLYHQLKDLTERQQQLAGTNSPELLLEILTGRRKLIEKIRQLDAKLRPVKSNWQKLSAQITPEYKTQAHKMANQVQKIIGQILAAAPARTTQNLPLATGNFHELFAKTQVQ